ncbi:MULTISPECIES: WXG100 family type VII secretion target [Streptomyces]|uniref:WXG100 family type VII secretion target n=1 Tax=Streptomyces TaxID=1883 RepID=UPI00226FD03A|nr:MULTISPECIES: WXG100 family type VII secretion target [unclassified Streptomyces]MCY0941825.1 WXG100 family type VII secretion target [Streptomyces sp. H34-AA3]MCY0949241.1 WXG100 family type VII secretion target [Streptomyces sp. H27-S2]MCZ4086811.1 WXG100 family type VII secretion target [Streptomyces sp. H34-S5]
MSDFTDGHIYVDYRHMSNAADDMVAQTKAIAGVLANLEAELQELKQTWEGEDRQVYNTKQQAWDHAVEEMKNLLANHSRLLTDVSDNYQYSEKSLTQMWGDVRIGR